MQLKSLLLCSDEKIVRILRRTLSDLDIGVEHCTAADAALRQLTRNRFEAIIVDCAVDRSAEVLRGAGSAPVNKRAIAVAILDPEVGLRSAFAQGAHFTLYKPVSAERSRSSFRAARALMKRERRRNARIPVTLPVEMISKEGAGRFNATTTDIGEGGLAINLPKRTKPQGKWTLVLNLPGMSSSLELASEFAWQGTGSQVGMRFLSLSLEVEAQLREWLSRNSPDAEQDDPPVPCSLTDLSLRGCYLSLTSPFPVSTRVTLSMSAAGVALRSPGIVRIMHAEKGMGVEFTQTTREHRASFEKFMAALTENPDALPELMVEPEGLETDITTEYETEVGNAPNEDPLLNLFRHHADLGYDEFRSLLGKQRGLTGAAAAR
jgi:hypothetical protein